MLLSLFTGIEDVLLIQYPNNHLRRIVVVIFKAQLVEIKCCILFQKEIKREIYNAKF